MNMFEEEKAAVAPSVENVGGKATDDAVKEIKTRIVKNFLDIIILQELEHKSGLGGYDIMMIAHNKFGTMISSGTVYMVLYALQRKGLVNSLQDSKRTFYELTDKGLKVLDSFKESKEALTEFMKSFFTL